MTPSTTLNIFFNKKNSKLILQIDFSQMDTETQKKFLADLFEKALQIKQIGVLKVITYEMTQALKNQIIHLTQVVNEENLEFDEELVIYHLDFKLNQNTYKVLAKFCVLKKKGTLHEKIKAF